MNPDSNPNSDTNETSAQPKTISAPRIILAILFVGACAMAGIDYQARTKWQTAVSATNKLFDEDNDAPKDFMDAIGSTPRVTLTKGRLTQIYRWSGSLYAYDLHITFFHNGLHSALESYEPMVATVFSAPDLSEMTLAKANTGALDEKTVATKKSGESTNPMSPMGGGGGGLGGGGRGGGDQSSGAGGRSEGGFQGFNDSDLNMDKDTQAKWDDAVKLVNKAMADLPEDRRAAFTKRRELQQKFREEAKGYLSKEQYATFEKNNPTRQRGGRSGINAEQLGLEGEAKTKYEAATGKLSEQLRALYTGGGGGSNEERRKKMTAMRDKYEVELKTILDEDQFKKYQELRSQQRQTRGNLRGPGGGPGGGFSQKFKTTKPGTKND